MINQDKLVDPVPHIDPEVIADVTGFSEQTFQTIMLCLGIQACIGILGLEFAWSRTKRMR